MAKKTQAQQEAIDALYFIEKEADLRKEINSSYESYIEQIKQYSTLQKTYNKSVELESKTRQKIKDIKNGTIQASKHELDVEEEKLILLEEQNKKLKEQGKIYKAAFKDANKWSLTAAGTLKAVGNTVSTLKQGYGMLKSFGLFEMDKAMKNSALSMGILSNQSKGFRDTITTASKQTAYIGVSLQDIARIQSDYSEELGRSVQMNEKSLVAMGQLSKFADLGAEGAARMAADMDKQGISAEKTGEFMNQTLNDSHAMGVNASKVIKNIALNVKMLNKYRFKDGVKGLAKMAMTASKLGVDMEFAGGMADKLFDIEGAVDMSAQLQVMGGAWAQMADPFHLMYMARNDMEGLTEEIANAAKQSMSFAKDGSIEMGAMEMHRLKIVAQQTGLEYDKLVEAGKAAFKLSKVKAQIGNVSPELQEFIANTSEFKDGKATILIGDNPKLISALTTQDKKLLEANRIEKASMKKRAEDSLTFDEAFTNFINGMKIYLLPFITTINEKLLPKFNELTGKWEKQKWGEKLEALAKTVGEFASGIGKFIIKIADFLGPTGSLITGLALWGGLKVATWIANGVALGTGFKMATVGFGGGASPSMFSMGGAASNRGGTGFGNDYGTMRSMGAGRFASAREATKLNKWGGGARMGAGLGLGAAGMGVDYLRGKRDDPNDAMGKGMGVGASALQGAALGMMLGPWGALAGGLIGGGIGAYNEYFSEPQNDAVFAPRKGLGAEFSKGRGVLENGKITPIPNKEKFLSMEPYGPADRTMNQQNKQGSDNLKVEHGEMSINGNINLNMPGGNSIALEVMKTSAFQAEVARMVNSQIEKNKNQKPTGA
jgi:hypothetical protein